MVYNKFTIGKPIEKGGNKMPFNYSKLEGRIEEKFGTRGAFAKALGVSERTMSLKMNGVVSWKQSEISAVCQILDIKTRDIPLYFFAK